MNSSAALNQIRGLMAGKEIVIVQHTPAEICAAETRLEYARRGYLGYRDEPDYEWADLVAEAERN